MLFFVAMWQGEKNIIIAPFFSFLVLKGKILCPAQQERFLCVCWSEINGENVELKMKVSGWWQYSSTKERAWRYIRKVFLGGKHFSLLCTPWNFPFPVPDLEQDHWEQIISLKNISIASECLESDFCCFWVRTCDGGHFDGREKA